MWDFHPTPPLEQSTPFVGYSSTYAFETSRCGTFIQHLLSNKVHHLLDILRQFREWSWVYNQEILGYLCLCQSGLYMSTNYYYYYYLFIIIYYFFILIINYVFETNNRGNVQTRLNYVPNFSLLYINYFQIIISIIHFTNIFLTTIQKRKIKLINKNILKTLYFP